MPRPFPFHLPPQSVNLGAKLLGRNEGGESKRVMNDLSNVAVEREPQYRHCYNPIPKLAILILIPLFLLGFGVSIFILVLVHDAAFFVFFLFLSVIVSAFILWNILGWRRKTALLFFLRSFPDTDLRLATDGQLVKITGAVSCGNISLETSYEKVTQCVYSSTLLYEYKGFQFNEFDAQGLCFLWKLIYSERFATDFYISDKNSGITVLVKAGFRSEVIPLVVESRLINTTRKNRVLSTSLRNWLLDRRLSDKPRLMRLEEGYIKEGSYISVMGTLRKDSDILMLVQPSELISTGCLWHKLLLPFDFEGIVIGSPQDMPCFY